MKWGNWGNISGVRRQFGSVVTSWVDLTMIEESSKNEWNKCIDLLWDRHTYWWFGTTSGYLLTVWDELRHIELNCDEWRRIEWHQNEIETICIKLMTSLRHVRRSEDDFGVSGAMAERLGDRLKHFHRIELNRISVEYEDWANWVEMGKENGFEIGLDAV